MTHCKRSSLREALFATKQSRDAWIASAKKRSRNDSGFTLIELVMVILIVAVISIVLSRVLFQAAQTFQTANNINEVDWQGFLALERMTIDIHQIRSSSDITTISASQLNFTDVNGNSVQYSLSGSNLLRNSQTLASGIQSLSMTYLDSNGLATATPSLVRYITLSVTATNGNITQTYSTLVGTRVLP